jgi:hypothetical protein
MAQLNATGGHLHRFKSIHSHKWCNALTKSITKASRTNNTLEVIQHMNSCMAVVEVMYNYGNATQLVLSKTGSRLPVSQSRWGY